MSALRVLTDETRHRVHLNRAAGNQAGAGIQAASDGRWMSAGDAAPSGRGIEGDGSFEILRVDEESPRLVACADRQTGGGCFRCGQWQHHPGIAEKFATSSLAKRKSVRRHQEPGTKLSDAHFVRLERRRVAEAPARR